MSKEQASIIEIELANESQQVEGSTRAPLVAGHKVNNLRAAFLIFRSLVGIGVLTMPHAVQHFGVNGAVVFFPIFAVVILYVLDLVLRIAADLGYNGDSIEELIELSGNGAYLRAFSIMNNAMMIATGIVNCIFAGRLASN